MLNAMARTTQCSAFFTLLPVILTSQRWEAVSERGEIQRVAFDFDRVRP
jgi:hypothetical protein